MHAAELRPRPYSFITGRQRWGLLPLQTLLLQQRHRGRKGGGLKPAQRLLPQSRNAGQTTGKSRKHGGMEESREEEEEGRL